jgi:hypothetical protein
MLRDHSLDAGAAPNKLAEQVVDLQPSLGGWFWNSIRAGCQLDKERGDLQE